VENTAAGSAPELDDQACQWAASTNVQIQPTFREVTELADHHFIEPKATGI